ncbi:receptor-like protein 3 [Pistacia vera]|uniref:receptor-like protein 3 n=1 Tax=Pistacia vera TaxID=55513 RepID=UPI0012633E53|nr:receptor-like protein 3 [Pistacia vera]
MVKLIIDLVLLVFMSWFAYPQQTCNRLDQQSLLSLNFTLPSPPLNWSSSIKCCLWEGIKCNADGYVTHLFLLCRGLSGSISPSIGNLTHLYHINLSHNRLSGPLPNSYFPSLTRLETLDLSYNYISGEFLSSLSSNYIKIVDLSSNIFHGMIPSSFFRLAKRLRTFNISNNSFTGVVPSSTWTGSVCSVSILDFSYNEFSGPVPLGLGNCSKLKTFRAGFNSLSGSLPEDIFSVTSLEEISLPVNYLSGSISNGIVNLSGLSILELYSNQLIGLIPRDIGKLTNLKILLLYDNYLSGSLPPSMKNCINLTTLNLRNNSFEGELSAFNFSALLQLCKLDLGNNHFTGSLQLTFNSCKFLTTIRLSSNHLVGQISPDIVALESLSYLSLSRNFITNITGAIRILKGCQNLRVLILSVNFIEEAVPDDNQITFSHGFQNLQVLALGGCQLRGQVPTWIGKLRRLQVLDLSANQITGEIPGLLENLTSLFYMDLSQNLMSGKIPKKLGEIPMFTSKEANDQANKINLELPIFVIPMINALNLQYNKILYLPPATYLANNSFSDSIPIEIGQLKFLHVLDLSHNKLSGEIPNQLSQLTNLEQLDLSANQLSGKIPASFSSLNFLSSFNVADNNLQGTIPAGGQFRTFPSTSFEGNPGLCGYILENCSIQPKMNSPPEPRESSNNELGYGLIAGGVFGFIIGFTIGILYPLHRLKFLQYFKEWRMTGRGRNDVEPTWDDMIALT